MQSPPKAKKESRNKANSLMLPPCELSGYVGLGYSIFVPLVGHSYVKDLAGGIVDLEKKFARSGASVRHVFRSFESESSHCKTCICWCRVRLWRPLEKLAAWLRRVGLTLSADAILNLVGVGATDRAQGAAKAPGDTAEVGASAKPPRTMGPVGSKIVPD
jgi:hypothetical protein